MNIHCNIIKDLLSLYHDGVCSEESRKLIEQHLKSCEDCRAELQAMNAPLDISLEPHNDKNSAKAASKALKKFKTKSFVIGCTLVLLSIVILISIYLGAHWYTTVRGNADMAQQAAHHLKIDSLNIEQRQFSDKYTAALCVDDNGNKYMCVYKRDIIFKNRWRMIDGKLAVVTSGQIVSWDFGNEKQGSIIVIYGSKLPDEMYSYTFEHGDKRYIVTILDNEILDIFNIPDTYDSSGTAIPLDKDLNPIQ